ncbi:hypothetical protein PA15_0321205 [Pseudomonas aeruginosa HB15]|nr:hypothetical protein PA15_0321205 [Pseudomonas aeruginosa HB15]KAJ12638.1 hypothetical protein M002_16335 [Pseudomonas aeruginosa ID4365]KFB21924.1 hypothetical protein PGPR2_30185 [Pseudomonas aeruginosa PGPR2]
MVAPAIRPGEHKVATHGFAAQGHQLHADRLRIEVGHLTALEDVAKGGEQVQVRRSRSVM